MSQETQIGALYQPRRAGWGGCWEGGSKGRGYMYTYGWFEIGRAHVWTPVTGRAPSANEAWGSKDGDTKRHPRLCINLEGWDGPGDGRKVQKGGDICIPMADSSWGLTEDKEKNCKFRPLFPIPTNHHGFTPVSLPPSSSPIYSFIFCIPLYLGNLLTGQDVSSSPIPQAWPHWFWWPVWL